MSEMKNPLKDIPFEELKKYIDDLGYKIVKKAPLRVKVNPCPICGKLPRNVYWSDQIIKYSCASGCGVSGDVYSVGYYNLSKAELDNWARESWNRACETIKEGRK